MRLSNSIPQKLYNLPGLLQQVVRWRFLGKKIVFTNGCFDILHSGHMASLSEAAGYGDVLLVGINADSSVKKLKGENRPVNNEQSRALIIASLAVVDSVIIFEEETPLNLVNAVKPDVLVKGGDYKVEDIAGAAEVLSWGGQVIINPIIPGFSTTDIIDKIQHSENTAAH
ncbi:MAG TPA: D-glycero-beta-D-manno-heptose 1-phosphate adenylyltransferase [Chitinophagaceae bacterium]|nr:D-glycero-beta-D-manno-heptose 1-phosphate adenylyltransferase [Chitinophagaceae bacterium]